MAQEAEEGGEKTEEPTGRRLERAFEEGNLQWPRDTYFLALLLAVLPLFAIVGVINADLTGLLRTISLSIGSGTPQLGLAGSDQILQLAWLTVVKTLALSCFGFVVAVTLAGLAQQGFRFQLRPLNASLDKVSPLAGFRRIFGLDGLIENGLSTIKMLSALIVFVVVGRVLFSHDFLLKYVDSGQKAPAALADWMQAGVNAALLVLIVFAALDFALKRRQNMKNLRMTKQEVKEEFKEQEGDPHIRGRLKRLRQERRKRGGIANVPTADVVLTNPTHYAVALRYETASKSAPKLVAKGAGTMAKRIVKIARRHGVPILRVPPVTRTIFFRTDIDAEIPESVYEEVARIIVQVYQMKKRSLYG